MNDLETRVRDAVGDILDLAPRMDSAAAMPPTPEHNRRSIMLAALAMTVAFGLVGFLLVQRVSDPVRTVPPAPFEIGDGRLTLDPAPDGVLPAGAGDGSTGGVASGQPVTRVYAVDHLRPESQPAIVVTITSPAPEPPASAEPIDVGGFSGHVWRWAPHAERLIFGKVRGYTIVVDGYHVTRAELVKAAAAVELITSDVTVGAIALPPSPIIDPDALPNSATELPPGATVGWFEPVAAPVGRMTWAQWSDGANRSLLYETQPETPGMVAGTRLGYQSVTDIEINGRPAFIATGLLGDSETARIVLADGDRVIFIDSSGLTSDELVAAVRTMRPATPDEWEEMISTLGQTANPALPETSTSS